MDLLKRISITCITFIHINHIYSFVITATSYKLFKINWIIFDISIRVYLTQKVELFCIFFESLIINFQISFLVSLLLTFVFLTKSMDSKKNNNSFQNKNNRKAHTLLLQNHWFLSCNWKFFNTLLSAWPREISFRVGKFKFWECEC